MNEQQENPTNTQGRPSGTDTYTGGSRSGKGGRYLKQTSGTRHRRRRRRRNPQFVILMSLLALALIILVVGIFRYNRTTLDGRWDLDGSTVYEFGDDGNGSLILMNAEYEFSYVIEDDMLMIDFVDDYALDARYTFTIAKNIMFWTGGPGDAKQDYVLKRIIL